jgi:hypothetical protein
LSEIFGGLFAAITVAIAVKAMRVGSDYPDRRDP